MSRRIISVGGSALLLAALAALPIPAESAELSCVVPFGFVVDGKSLPAGHYQISTERSALILRGVRGGAVVLTMAMESRQLDAKLVFHKYGRQLILREVRTGGGAGRVIPESALERELKEQVRSADVLFERVTIPAL